MQHSLVGGNALGGATGLDVTKHQLAGLNHCCSEHCIPLLLDVSANGNF